MKGPIIPLLILGGGYTGRVIYRQASLLKHPLLVSSRKPETQLAGIPGEERLFFDLRQENSWSLLPEAADVIWAFPAVPLDQVMRFGREKGIIFRRLIILGSTSAYPPSQSSEDIIDEKVAPDKTIPRVAGEEYLREKHGAIVLRAAGIYGPGRNPLDWIRQGRIGYAPRFVNFIHVEDLAGICLRALEKGKPGETYTVSDGTPRTWSEIIDVAEERWGLSRPVPGTPASTGKKISNRKVVEKLLYQFRFPDLYAVLNQLEHR
ncbi:MAG: Rossmann-fold NAD(P)-binding domain-containing protein [Nitrospiria bacterium]